MVVWTDFGDQSRRDIAASNLLWNAGDYGNAAYHLQQAVEKHTKCILMHGSVMPNQRTHLPLSEFLEEFVTGMVNFKTIAVRHNIHIFDTVQS